MEWKVKRRSMEPPQRAQCWHIPSWRRKPSKVDSCENASSPAHLAFLSPLHDLFPHQPHSFLHALYVTTLSKHIHLTALR